MKRIALYAGSFDPPTNGHHWMIRQGAALFDELIVTLAVNPEKKSCLSIALREKLLSKLVADVPGNVRVARVENAFLVDFAQSANACYLLRGIRNSADLEYEKTMARMNARMAPGIQTVFLTPPAELEGVSSSMVRGFLGLNGWPQWVRACVPPCVYEAIEAQEKKA